MKTTQKIPLAIVAFIMTIGAAQAATVIIQSDSFEGMSQSSLSANETQETLSGWKDVTSQYNALSVSTGANARTDQPGFGGTYGTATNAGIGVRVRSSTGAMTLDAPMKLLELEASSVTITFDLKEVTADYFLVLQYSANAAFTVPLTIATFNGNTTEDLGVWRAKSYTLTDGEGGVVFSDDAYFMVRKISSGITGTNPDFHVFDNIVISAEVIPEPSSALLGSLGVLALLRRRR
jgi:hypothetical protein